MATAKEIKGRLSSVRETAKITNAMYLIASSKMQKARTMMRNAHPYMDFVRKEIENIFANCLDADSIYFLREGEQENEGSPVTLVITADRGLCGSYNTNVLKAAERLFTDHPEMKAYIVGDYGRRYFEKHGFNFEKSFELKSRLPDMQEAREISEELLELYDAGRACEVYVLYSQMTGGMSSEPALFRVLPFERADFAGASASSASGKHAPEEKYEFIPSVEAVLDNALRSLCTGIVFGALAMSFSAEQNARVFAMKAANDNAAKLMEELNLKYNRIRQNTITNEIIEISSGEMALKRKKKKASNG